MADTSLPSARLQTVHFKEYQSAFVEPICVHCKERATGAAGISSVEFCECPTKAATMSP